MAHQDETLFEKASGLGTDGPVECLGLSFINDEERRAHFTQLLREKLADPQFRSIDGFPVGEDDDILKLSDPPCYTACPNPWLADFVTQYGKPFVPEVDEYEREPFAADISEGKNDSIYQAHSYHTKVPHKAIMRYVLHYTEPGDVILDGFCGTGMTGVAARFCGDRTTLLSLGYVVEPDGGIRDESGAVFSKIGARRAILNDLSPAASFIAYNYNVPEDLAVFKRDGKRILETLERECGWMYLTLVEPTKQQLDEALALLSSPGPDLAQRAPHLPWARVKYTIWSDVLVCPNCGSEFVFWDAAVDFAAGTVAAAFSCPACGASLSKRETKRAQRSMFDDLVGTSRLQARQVPVLMHCKAGKRSLDKVPDSFDLGLIRAVEALAPPDETPSTIFPVGDKTGEPIRLGLKYVRDLYTSRDLQVIGRAFVEARRTAGAGVTLALTSLLVYASKLSRWRPGNRSGPLSGTLYISSTVMPLDSLTILPNRLRRIEAAKAEIAEAPASAIFVQTGTASALGLGDATVDYIFIDPPFGANIMYSELNLPWEAWLRVHTNASPEAVESRAQQKKIKDYGRLIGECFGEYHRVLKPGRWMTVEFHNSSNAIWMAIQDGLQRAGFVVADVRTLDKKQGSFNQATAAGAVKQDLIISAYRPRADVERQFELEAGSADGAWTFMLAHLRQVPVVVGQGAALEIVAERQAYLLYDRMVAFHVQRGVQVPLSAAEFYAGLEQGFPCRDGMYFLPEQVAEYDRKRLQAQEVKQLELFVTDEESAIEWLRRELADRPMSFQDIHPLFMREIAGWEKHEKPLELSELLQENFIRFDGGGDVPSQIHAYLSSNFREMRGLDKNDSSLRAKAKDRWFVPDSRKAGDLEQLRERTLLKEFDEYGVGTGKLKLFRLEAMRAGFKRAWQEHEYKTIVTVAERLPADVLQEDAKLLMWYEQALTRAGE